MGKNGIFGKNWEKIGFSAIFFNFFALKRVLTNFPPFFFLFLQFMDKYAWSAVAVTSLMSATTKTAWKGPEHMTFSRLIALAPRICAMAQMPQKAPSLDQFWQLFSHFRGFFHNFTFFSVILPKFCVFVFFLIYLLNF